MCGICGIVDLDRQPSIETVERMALALRHRGPDAGGVHACESCVLGHRRLSIVDLTESANQPMLSPDGLTALVFNGEIYNFQEIRARLEQKGTRFRTRSDTEVLLHLYLEKKEAMLEDLNGMFSLALWDEREKRLFLARDRMGKKPLYYRVDGPGLSFSSELYSLVQDPAVPRDLSPGAVFEYLLYDFIPSPLSVFRHVCKLPAAHAAVFDASGLRVWRYWTTPEPDGSPDYRQAQRDLTTLLEDAVRLRLIADVPLGAFLSGGIDSTLITSFMSASHDRRVKTFSISFPGTSHDESSWSALAADALGTDHTEYPVAYDIQDVFPTMVRHFGEPFGDSSAIPTWHLCRQTRTGVTVALSGDGGDELFGGYERYLARRFQLVYDCLPLAVRERLIEPLVDCLPATTDYYGTSLSKKLKLFVQAARRMREEPLAAVPRTFSRDEVVGLTGIAYEPDADPVLGAAREWVGLDPVSRMLFTDIHTYLAEDILTKVDRMSMAHALEVRSPLLDHRVVEFACRLPLSFKITGRTTKKILRDIARGRVPQSIVTRSKYGFQAPLGSWLKTDLKDWAAERLMDPAHGVFDPVVAEKIWQDHQTGSADNAHKIWLLLFLGEWARQFLGT
jgi:asparagine synthase (glutamine-hydrolysing)